MFSGLISIYQSFLYKYSLFIRNIFQHYVLGLEKLFMLRAVMALLMLSSCL